MLGLRKRCNYSLSLNGDGFESCDGGVSVAVAKKKKSTELDSGQSYISTNY
ncbi:MAG: hypothetical protein ACJASI_002465 [Glaciecola sp.]|jgi:hypothetical protein